MEIMNQELIEKFKSLVKKLHISGFENIDLLLKLTRKDIENQTDLSYAVTILLEKLQQYSNIYCYLDEEEQEELLSWNHDDFFGKIIEMIRISDDIIDVLFLMGIAHPILEANMELDDTIDSKEDYIEYFEELKEILPEEDSYLLDDIKMYHKVSVEPYKQHFQGIVVPTLKETMLEDNYEKALNCLADYISIKLKFESNSVDNINLILAKISEELHQLLNSETIHKITDMIEEEDLDTDDLEEEEYLNLVILMFENRYLRHKSCRYYYKEKLKEATSYYEKCKKR